LPINFHDINFASSQRKQSVFRWCQNGRQGFLLLPTDGSLSHIKKPLNATVKFTCMLMYDSRNSAKMVHIQFHTNPQQTCKKTKDKVYHIF